MSKKKKKSATLPVFFFFCAASAGAAFFARESVAEFLKPYVTNVSRETLAYAAVFSLSFIALTLAARLRGITGVSGFAPRVARGFLAAFIFAAPLVAVKIGTAEKSASPEALFGTPPKKPESGYAKTDREKLDALMEKKHDAP